MGALFIARRQAVLQRTRSALVSDLFFAARRPSRKKVANHWIKSNLEG